MFTKVEREATLADVVSKQIQGMIVERQLMPNDRLPAERDLAEQLGVSRTVVREAVRSLTAKGLLEVVRGRGGTVVRSPTAATMSEMMALFLRGDERALDYENLIEVRRVLETAIAGIAAERRTPEDLREMQVILDETLKIGNDREAFRHDLPVDIDVCAEVELDIDHRESDPGSAADSLHPVGTVQRRLQRECDASLNFFGSQTGCLNHHDHTWSV